MPPLTLTALPLYTLLILITENQYGFRSNKTCLTNLFDFLMMFKVVRLGYVYVMLWYGMVWYGFVRFS